MARVHGRDAALQGQHLQKLGNRRDLVRLGIGCDLAWHQTLLAAPGADHVRSRFGARGVERSARDLTVNRDNALAGLGKARHEVLKAAPKLLRLQRAEHPAALRQLSAHQGHSMRFAQECRATANHCPKREIPGQTPPSPRQNPPCPRKTRHRTEPYRAQSAEALEDHVAARCPSEGLLPRKNTPETCPSHPPGAITKLSVESESPTRAR